MNAKTQLWNIPKVGDYYRVRRSTDSLAEGTIVVVTKATKTRIEVGDGSHDGWHYTPVEFQKDFEHLPDGAEGYLYENEVVMLAFDRAEEVADGL